VRGLRGAVALADHAAEDLPALYRFGAMFAPRLLVSPDLVPRAGAALFRLLASHGSAGHAQGVHGTGPCLPDGCLRSIRVSAAHSSTGEFWQMVFPRLRAIQDRSWGELVMVHAGNA